jgi:hypothetical protein
MALWVIGPSPLAALKIHLANTRNILFLFSI